jgi:mono/diheme cytochrome c family protein
VSKSNFVSAISIALIAGAASAVALASSLTTRDGVFTEAQAARGKAVYDKSCVNCHPVDFYRDRLTRYENKPVSGLFEVVSVSMPQDNAGSLLTSEYLDVLAYIFSVTGSPAGTAELTTDSMETVNVAAPK